MTLSQNGTNHKLYFRDRSLLSVLNGTTCQKSFLLKKYKVDEHVYERTCGHFFRNLTELSAAGLSAFTVIQFPLGFLRISKFGDEKWLKLRGCINIGGIIPLSMVPLLYIYE